MHITLHLTSNCNMRCSYCYAKDKKKNSMSKEVIAKSIEFCKKFSNKNIGIIFFGGEPLLEKNLIIFALRKCIDLEEKEGIIFHYKITTNGLKLDEKTINFFTENRIRVAISIDGIEEVHNFHRKDLNGKDTFNKIIKNARILLKYQPYSQVFMVLTPETVKFYSKSFKFLYDFGFRYIISSIDYSSKWDKKDLKILKKEYHKILKIYEKILKENGKIYFSPFEKKWASHILGKDAICQQCQLGMRQISIDPNGEIYPCVQFVSKLDFKIGDVWKGIDIKKQIELYKSSREEMEECKLCALNLRCEHRCGCLNLQTTGSILKVSPLLCETEKFLIKISDKLGEKLYKEGNSYFIQSHYNPIYPILSAIEDKI